MPSKTIPVRPENEMPEQQIARIRCDLSEAERIARAFNNPGDGWKVTVPMKPKLRDDGFQAYTDLKFLLGMIDSEERP